jgi:hypothetical protein
MMGKLIVIILWLCPSIVYAQIIPLDGLSMRMIFPADGSSDSARTINVNKVDAGWRVSWAAMEKVYQGDVPYPTWAVKARKGSMDFDGFSGKTGLLHPRLWGEGYFQLTHLLPLWVDKDFLFLDKKKNETRAFNVGVLDPSQVVLQSASEDAFAKLNRFQALYNHFIEHGQVRETLSLKRQETDELNKFARDFFLIRHLAQTEVNIVLNREKKTVLGQILGNDYFHLVVLRDFQNPLVLAVIFHPEKVPVAFRPFFEDFEKSYAYQITQVNY